MQYICKYNMFAIPVNDCKFIGLTTIFSCSQPKNENTEDIHLNKMEYKDLFLFSEQKQLKKKKQGKCIGNNLTCF